MEIVVLGGAGDMGSRTVEDLAAEPGVRRVTIADWNLAAAQRLADQLRQAGAEVVARQVDARDHAALVEVLRGHDVIASALGPYYRFERLGIAAALDAGVDYASICDEWDATEQALSTFDERARAEGRKVITGLGASPGVSNLTVACLAAELDAALRAEVAVFLPLDAGGGAAVVQHALHIATGDTVIWRDGRRCAIPACSQTRRVELPRFGRMRMWNLGHAEPITLPRQLPDLERVEFFMGFGLGSAVLVGPARLRLYRHAPFARAYERLLTRVSELIHRPEAPVGAMRVDVWGELDGRPAHRIGCGSGQMREVTGLALSVGTLMLARGEHLVSREGGVRGPEGYLQAIPFLRAMQAKGVGSYRDLALRQPLVD